MHNSWVRIRCCYGVSPSVPDSRNKECHPEEVVSQGVDVEAIADKAAPSAADWTLLSFVYMADGRRVGTDRPADKDL